MGREIAPSKGQAGEFWKRTLQSWEASMKALLPATLTPERMSRLILVTFQKNPALMQCRKESVYASIMEAAKLGLEIDCQGQAWLIPYKDQCQLIVGYQGMLQLVYNSGMVRFCKAEVVRSNDLFEYEETDTGAIFRHKPHWMIDPGSEPGDFMACYATATLPDGTKVSQVYGRPTIERHREASAAWRSRKSDSPWFTHEEEMWKKTALRAFTKLLPKSTNGARAVGAAVALDEAADRGEQGATIDADFSVDAPEMPREEEPEVKKPAAPKNATPEVGITGDESKALYAMAEQKKGASARDVIRATLKAHGITQAAKIPRRLYDTIWAEVEAGTHVTGKETETEGSVHAGAGHDSSDQGQLEGM